jgi:hypothetical protein
MKDAKRSVVGVSTRPRDVASRSKMVDSFGGWSGTMVCNPVASKDPCWSSFHLNGGGGGSSVTGGRTRSLCDKRSSGSSTV